MNQPLPTTETISEEKLKQGFIKLWRCARSDPFYLEPRVFSRWEAFESLVLKSAFAAHTVFYHGRAWHVRRGEVIASVRQLAQEWQWSRKKVEAFLRVANELGKLSHQVDRDGIRIKITNYDTYQDALGQKEPGKSHKRATEEPRDKNNITYTSNKRLTSNSFIGRGDAVASSPHPNPLPPPSQPKEDPSTKIAVDDHGLIYLSPDEVDRLEKKLGFHCLNWLIKDASEFAAKSPKKFATYKSHAAFLSNQVKYKHERGLSFYKHPDKGYGFYPDWQIEKLKGGK